MTGMAIGYMVSGALLIIAALLTFRVVRVNGRFYIVKKTAEPKVEDVGLFERVGGGIFTGKIIAMEHDLVCLEDHSVIRFPRNYAPSCAFFIFFTMMKEEENGANPVPPGNLAVLTASGGREILRFVPADLYLGKVLMK